MGPAASGVVVPGERGRTRGIAGDLFGRLVSNGPLDSPRGMAIAPSSFGAFAGDLFVANFGDGHVNAFVPVSGSFIGALSDSAGEPLTVFGWWGLIDGNGGSGGNANQVYFTAGIPGGGRLEDHGLFGSVAPAPTAPVPFIVRNLVSDLDRRRERGLGG